MLKLIFKNQYFGKFDFPCKSLWRTDVFVVCGLTSFLTQNASVCHAILTFTSLTSQQVKRNLSKCPL